MLFNSLHFLFFLPVVLLLYYLLPFRYRWMLIFVASCYFYMALVPAYILILFFIIIVDYFAALVIEQLHGRLRKGMLAVSIIANLSLLAFFKYFNFANENVSWLLHHFHITNPVSNLNILLPIGLSFHTFQSMAYTIEVYRGNQKAERHLGYFSNYVLFFPQMVAGPIERYDRLGNQLKVEHKFNYLNFAEGFRLMLFGFFAKVTIADNLAPYVNEVYADPAHFNSLSVAMAIILFAFQIYADFFGYSLIAMGAAKCMGINLMENFKTPFLSRSVTEFWRRWHISLSTWFNDYLFTPYITARRNWGKWAVISGLFLTFFLSGLWHGAGWNFAIYGSLHGLALIYEFVTKKQRKKLSSAIPGWIYSPISVLLTFIFVCFSWIFFRAENIQKAKLVIKSALHNREVPNNLSIEPKIWVLLVLFILLDSLLFNKRVDSWLGARPIYLRWSMYAALIFCVTALGGVDNVPFIYFQF